MGLDYGTADRPGSAGQGGVFGRGKGKQGVLGGRISVDSMKLKYEEGWGSETVSSKRASPEFVPRLTKLDRVHTHDRFWE